jgi:hypothetical protein
MAQKNIGLRIEINGFKGVVTNLEQLNTLIKESKQDLQQLEIGSSLFNELTGQIKIAETQYKKFQEQAQGQSLEKSLEGYGKLVGGITSSFAAAQAAVSLFGTESEAVTEAATQAQNLLTIALAARSIGEIKAGLTIVATTIATKAQTLATNATTTATRALYLTLAANPYTAILALIGVLITAYIAFKSESEDLTGAIDENTDAFDRAKTSQEAYLNSIKTNFEEGLLIAEKDKLSSQEVLDFKLQNIDNQIEALNRFEQENKKYIERINDLNLQQAINEGKSDIEIAKIKLENQRKILDNERDSQNKIDALRSERRKLLIKNEIDTQKEVERKEKEAQDKRRARLISDYDKRLELQIKFLNEIGKLNESDVKVSAEILERANKLLAEGESLLNQRQELYTTETEKFTKELDELLFKIIPTPKDLKDLQDGYLSAFFQLGTEIRQGLVPLLDETGKAVDFSFKQILKILNDSNLPEEFKSTIANLNEEQQKVLVQFYTRLTKTAERFSKDFNIGGQIINPSTTKTIKDDLFNLISGVRTILADPSILPGLREVAIKNLILSIFEIPEKQQKDFINKLDETGEKGFKKYEEGVNILLKSLSEFGIVQANQINDTVAVGVELEKLVVKLLDVRNALGDVESAAGIIPGAEIVKLTTEQITEFSNFLVEKLTQQPQLLEAFFKDISLKTDFYVERFGKEGLTQIFTDIGNSVTDLDKKSRKELELWLEYLINVAGTIKTEFGDEAAKAIEEAIERIQKAIKKLPKEASNDFDELLENILKGLQIFTQSISQIAALTRDRFSFELEKLESGYNKTLNQVVGDTKQANDKRLELEQQYQTQKAAIEKKARVRSLQFQLAQTIADTAAAVVRTIAEFGATPLGIGLSIVAGGIGAAQVGLIAEQISFAQSLRRGGNLSRMAAGGTITGPSHENGGVKFQNGGFELEGNEAVINRISTLNYSGLLSQINESGGGRPILVSSPMDSRLIEVLAKDRQTPIRAYVVEQDITEAQQINRKLEQLASF